MKKGYQSSWPYEVLSPHVDELVVAGVTQSRGPKSGARDALGLAQSLRLGAVQKRPTSAVPLPRKGRLPRARVALASRVLPWPFTRPLVKPAVDDDTRRGLLQNIAPDVRALRDFTGLSLEGWPDSE